MSTTSNQPSQPSQQTTEGGFDPETLQKMHTSWKDLVERTQPSQQSQQNAQSVNGKKFIKFTNDREHKRLLFTGNIEEDKNVPAKDFVTGNIIEGKFTTRFYFEVRDITDPNHPSTELATWERGIKDAKTILYWLANNKAVLDITRHGEVGNKNTTYEIYPPMAGR